MSREKQISLLYQKFSSVEGNQYIASEFAIRKIQSLINSFQVQSVLEVGLGIGTISGILLNRNDNLNYVGTENNSFCLDSLRKNLREHYSRLQIFDSINSIPRNQKFEIIIIDGKDGQLEKVKQLITPNGIIAIEGDRVAQLEVLDKLLPKNKMVHSISLVKNKSYSPFSSRSWQGGLKIIFVDPSKKQLLWWWMERIRTKIKYQYPGRYLGGS